MKTRFSIAIPNLLLALLLGACPDMDDGPELPTLTYDIAGLGSGPADLSCVGTRQAPSAGEAIDVTMDVAPFGSAPGTTVPGAVVQIFPDNQLTPDDSCPAESCIERTADSDGAVSFSVAKDAWFTYRVLAIEGDSPVSQFVRTIESNFAPPEPGGRPESFNTISQAVLTGLSAQAGADPVAGTAVASGAVLDCQGRPMRGAVLRVFSGGHEVLQSDARDGAKLTYFDGQLPPGIDGSATHTSTDGRFAGANLPIGVSTRIEMWGVADGESEPKLIACEEIDVFADSLSIVRLTPHRSDGLSACGSVPAR